MELSLDALRTALESHQREVGRFRARREEAGGSDAPPSPPALLRAPEAFASCSEQANLARSSEPDRERARLWLPYLSLNLEQALAAEAWTALERFERSPTVDAGDERLRWAEAHRALPRTTSRPKRQALERGMAEARRQEQSTQARRVQAGLEATRALGFASPPSLYASNLSLDLDRLQQHADAVLAKTEDAYRDLLGYLLAKADPLLRPLPQGDARWHDLQHALEVPSLLSHFPPSDVKDAVQRCLQDVGLLQASPGLKWDPRAPASAHAEIVRVQVPQDVRLRLPEEGGPQGLRRRLRSFGEALRASQVPAQAPPEERWLADVVLGTAAQALLGAWAADERWLRKYLGLASAHAREAARGAAFAELTRLRTLATRLGHALEVWQRGPHAALADDYRSRLSAALWVEVPAAFFLSDVAPQLGEAVALEGAAWAHLAATHLQERFDEDWWRNPASCGPLQALLGSPGRGHWQETLKTKAPDLTALGARWVRTLGA